MVEFSCFSSFWWVQVTSINVFADDSHVILHGFDECFSILVHLHIFLVWFNHYWVQVCELILQGQMELNGDRKRCRKQAGSNLEVVTAELMKTQLQPVQSVEFRQCPPEAKSWYLQPVELVVLPVEKVVDAWSQHRGCFSKHFSSFTYATCKTYIHMESQQFWGSLKPKTLLFLWNYYP